MATATGEATASAIVDEGESRDWGTSQEDLEAYAAAAGGVAGVAACAAVGAAAAAPLCGTIGAWASEYIVGTLVSWCTSSRERERAERRRREVRQLHNRIVQIEAWERLNGDMLNERIEALRDLHSQLWPGVEWVSTAPDVIPSQRPVYPAIILLASHGMPIEAREGEFLATGLPSLSAEWEQLRHEMSDAALFDMLQAEAIEISDAIGRAYDRSVIELTGEGAGDRAEARARRPEIRQVSAPPRRMTTFGQGGPGELLENRLLVPESKRGYGAAAWRLAIPIVGTAAGVALWRAVRGG